VVHRVMMEIAVELVKRDRKERLDLTGPLGLLDLKGAEACLVLRACLVPPGRTVYRGPRAV